MVNAFIIPVPDINEYRALSSPQEYDPNKLHLIKRLGEGNFGYVYKAEATDICGVEGQITVAVKLTKGETY